MKVATHDNDNQKLPATRAEAKATGSKRYFTGKACVHGHAAPRVTINGNCLVCAFERTSQFLKEKWANDPEWRNKKNADEKTRRHKPENLALDRPKNAERVRRRRQEFPEIAEKSRRICREYYQKVRKHDPAYKEAKIVHHRTRRSRKLGNEGVHKPEDITEILKRQKFKCAECGVSVKDKKNRHVDHIMPLALGGSNWPTNLQILCPPCNLSKSAKHPIDFAQRKGRLL